MMSEAGDPVAKARQQAEAGTRVIAVIGWRVPVQILHAAGFHTVQVMPDLTAPTPDADAFLSPEEKPPVRALLQTVIGGSLNFADLIVFAPPFAPVCAQVEDLRRIGALSEDTPPTHYFETMMKRGDAQRKFAIERTADLSRRIGALSGTPVTEDALETQIEHSNAAIAAVCDLLNSRSESAAPAGSAVMEAIGAARWMTPTDHAAHVGATAISAQRIESAPRLILISSSVLSDGRVHRIAEAVGANIIGEDDIYGSLYAQAPIAAKSGDAIAAIGSFIHDNQPMQRTYPLEVRRSWYHEQLRRGDVDGVIFYSEDPIWGWDVPAMRDAAAAAGKPTMSIMKDVRIGDNAAKAKDQIGDFIQNIREEIGA